VSENESLIWHHNRLKREDREREKSMKERNEKERERGINKRGGKRDGSEKGSLWACEEKK